MRGPPRNDPKGNGRGGERGTGDRYVPALAKGAIFQKGVAVLRMVRARRGLPTE
jgi:hypothetical protein